MTTEFTTTIPPLPPDTVKSLYRLTHDFTMACKEQGIWALADAIADANGNITFSLIIDETLRCKPGPRPKVTALSDERMATLRESGMAPEQIARLAGISRATFYRRMANMEEGVRHFDY